MTDLTWVLSSCVLIGVVIALRAAFGKRLRPGLRYALWGLVLLRLLYPGTVLSSPVSVKSAAEQTEVVRNFEAVRGVDSIEHMANGSVEGFDRYALMPERPITVAEQVTPERFARMETAIRARDLLETIWIVGIVVTVIAFLISNLRFYHTLRMWRKPLDADCPLRVYAVENLSSSCLFGNAIYVAAETAADETRLRHVLAHELSHHRHGDHVWTLLRCAALSLHWYNPLVWWAAALSRQDSELCADAGALKRLGEDERENYGATLIELSARRAPRALLLCTATTMTNGKKSLRERVTMIARRPRMTAAVVIAVVLIATVAAGCAFAGAAVAPMTEEEALDALEASVTLRSDDQGVSYVAFTLPEAYGRAEDWDIRIAGRTVYPDGMSKSVHEYELFPDVSDWEAGREYTIRSDNLTELTFQVALTGRDGKLYERGFDVFLPEFVIEEGANAGQTVRWNGDRASVNSVTLWSSGREFTAEEPESVGQVLDAIGNIVFTRGGDANAPGAQSLVATIRYRGGAEERVTFPCWERDGVTYDAGADSIERFAQFFDDWPEPQKQSDGADDGGTVTRWEADGDGTADTFFASIAGEYWFLSGAGAWHTELHLNADGTFAGEYRDWDGNTVYYCDFTGRFGDARQVNAYTWSMRLLELTAEQAEGEEHTEDGVRWIGSIPYGLDDVDEMLVYLPGAPVDDLPEDFLHWYCAALPYGRAQIGDALPYVGLYSVDQGYGWFAQKLIDHPAPGSNG